MKSVHHAAYEVLMLPDPLQKCCAMHALYQEWLLDSGTLEILADDDDVCAIPEPGRPLKPELVSPKALAKRSLHTVEGRLVLMHAIAHIEFNAINLAVDAVYRFRNQPKAFYSDWLKVADDEARHFKLVLNYLHKHNSDYGDYTAHNGLWEMVLKTDHDIVHRMALVPRVLEARGLDVSPAMIAKLKQAGDYAAADILTVIYHDEISHVEAGSRWFKHHCNLLDLKADETFVRLAQYYMKGKLKGPFNDEARLQAGFVQSELESLSQLE